VVLPRIRPKGENSAKLRFAYLGTLLRGVAPAPHEKLSFSTSKLGDNHLDLCPFRPLGDYLAKPRESAKLRFAFLSPICGALPLHPTKN